MAIEKQIFREAMAHLGAAVNVITTNGPAGMCGYTATAVCSVTDEPPTLLVCLNRGSEMYPVFRENGVLAVNVLTGNQQFLSTRFAGFDGVPMDRRFEDEQWRRTPQGLPVREDALTVFDCRIASVLEHGTHAVFFCEIRDIALNRDEDGLVYWRRRYHRLPRHDTQETVHDR